MKTPSSVSLRNDYRAFFIRTLRRSQPLQRMRQVLVMALVGALVLTSLPAIERLTPIAQAQIIQRICDPTQPGAENQIFQRCAVASGIEGALENEAINGLLSLHNLPPGDRGRLVNWERSKIRAALYDKLMSALQKSPASRTATEQSYVIAMTSLVKQRRVLATTKSLDEYNKWASSCPYTPPPGFTYNNGNCNATPLIRLPPTFEAFQAYGASLANSELQNDLAQQAAFKQTVKQLGVLGSYAGIAIAGGITAAIGASLITVATSTTAAGVLLTKVTVPALIAAIFPHAAKTVSGTLLFPSSVGVGAIAAPVVMLLFAVVTGIFVGIAVFEADQIPGKLQEAKNRAMNETPDLAQLLTTDAGRREVFGEFAQATFPDFPATGGVPAVQASDLKFRLTPENTLVPTLQYKDWDNNVHTVRLSDGWFVDRKGSEAERMTLSIEYKDWTGKRWTATRRGGEFWNAPDPDDSEQPVNTEQPFKSLELKYLDAGNSQKTAMIENSAPTIAGVGVTRRQEPPVPDSVLFLFPNANVSQIATVNDAEDAAGSLTVTVTSANPSKGITLSALRVESDGKVFARVQPACNAVVGNTEFTLQVADSLARTATTTLNVAVAVNAVPVLSYPELVIVGAGTTFTINPATGPSDDGGALGTLLIDGRPSLSVGPVFTTPSFQGIASASASDASITVQNAGPAGDHFIATSLQDSCSQITSNGFTLRVVACTQISVSTNLTNPRCNGASNGQITVNASGGNGALKYSINSGQTFQDSPVFSGLPAGGYTVIVKDSIGCASFPQGATLISPQPVTFTTSLVNLTCNGGSDGRITVNASGGTGAKQYSIDGGVTFQSSNVFTGLTAKSYLVTVKDANNCQATTQTVVLAQPEAIGFTTSLVSPTCNGASNGQITINASGGTGAKQYSINAGASFQSSSVFTGLTAGTYNVVVKDTNGCTKPGSVTLTQPSVVTVESVSVPGGAAGVNYPSLSFSASGGTGNLALTMTGALPQGMQFVGGVLSGTPLQTGSFPFTVTATDQNNCTASRNFALTVTCPAIALAPAGLPGAVAGIAYNQQLSAAPAGGNYTIAVTSGQLPQGLTLTSAGSLSGTPLQTGTFSFRITASGTGGFNGCGGAQDYQLTVVCPTVVLAPASLPNGDAGAAYSATLSATPSVGNYSFVVSNGQLPPGLSLNAATGAINGTPTQSGVYNFRVTASGTGGLNGCSGFRDYQINITGCTTITVGPLTLNSSTVGVAFNQLASASPSATYSYSISAGTLPPGLSLSAATGAITGTPQQAGAFSFTITASLGSCAGQRSYTMTVGCPGISLPALGNATIATTFSGSVAASPSGSYTYSITSGSLPGGLTLNTATGAVSGTPTASGSFAFTVRAQTADGCSAAQNYSLAVGCPTITLSDLAAPGLNTAFNQTVTATPASGGDSFAVTAGALPAGLSLNSATGAISGTPTAAGAYNFTITATGFGNCTGSRAYAGTIVGASCPTITLADLPGGAPGQMYNSSVTASPGGSYNYAVTSGNLPAGLTLYGSFGLVLGYPATAGSYNFTVTATDSNNCTGSKSYNMVIGGVPLRSLVFGDFDGDGKADLSVWRGLSGDWLTVASGDGKLKTEAWGSPAAPYYDVMTPGDYDGDGKMDLAVFRRSTGGWLIKGSKDGAVTAKVWGVGSDVPVPGDYDGDGKTDLAVWRGAETNWYILRSSDGKTQTVSWGTSRTPYRDVPVAADFDGDGKTDVAVFRQQNGHWYIKLSSDGTTLDKAWGLGTDVPVASDYDGDGKADIAVWRGAETNWYILRSSDGSVQTISWGTSSLGDVPVPGDFDGDGKADVAVWRATEGNWYAKLSGDNSELTRLHGQAGDTPVSRKPQL